jgi:hypothetical protein
MTESGLPWKLSPVAADFLERAGWSAGQVFFATLLAGGSTITVANLPWKYACALAFSAAVASTVLTGAQYLAKGTDLRFWPDLVVRMSKTFLASLAASFAAEHPFNIVEFDWETALNLAGVTVITALGKGLLARSGVNGGPAAAGGSNPSTLPTHTYLAATKQQ